MSTPKPVVLLILDGWGQREPTPDNAISQAHTPRWDALVESRPVCQLTTHGLAVGLPEGQMGNSEVGHMNIGAGRVVYQDFTRISQAINDGSFKANDALLGAIEHARATQTTLHVFGLLSPGGVHSHEDHLFATIDLALQHAVPAIALHVFTDGRDVAPRSALASLERLQPWLANGRVSLASVSGRYFAMDRDRRYDRTALAWRAMALAEANHHADSGQAAVEMAYARGEDDEFIQPTVIGDGAPFTGSEAGVFVNFRSDRARQLAHALNDARFDDFKRDNNLHLAALVTMTTYAEDLDCAVAFEPQRLAHGLGETVARATLTQLRIAETEKYAHVTYFFNGGDETVFAGESRQLIPSPKVATYDLQPQMSAPELAEALDQAITGQHHDLVVANVANPDMVGHTGDLNAAVAAVEAVDRVIGVVVDALDRVGGEVIITADHGNAEQMSDPVTGGAHTAHTTNTVPLIYVGPRAWSLHPTGSLRDIAPTLLALLGLDVPDEMTGQSLLDPPNAA